MRKKYRIFTRYLLSYLLILFLPLIIINGIYGRKVNTIYREEIMSNMQADLNTLSGALDAQISSMNSTVRQLSLMIDFNTYAFDDNLLKARSIMQLLSMYQNTSSFADEIILFMHEDEYLVSNTSTCSVDNFSRWMYQYTESSAQQMLDLFKSTQNIIVLPMQKVKTSGSVFDCLTVLVPVYTDYQTVRGTCIFMIKSRTLEQTVNEKLGKYDAQLYMSDKDGQILYKMGPLENSNIDIEGLISSNSYVDKNTRQKYFVQNQVSKLYGLNFTVLIPQNAGLTKRLGVINNALMSGTIVVILIAMAVIFLLMRMNYSPIRRLREKAATALPSYAHSGELEAISSTLDFLSDQNQYLAAKLENNVSGIKNIRLQELLTGRYKDTQQFNEACSDLHLTLPNSSFFVSCVLVHGLPSDWTELAEAIRSELPSDYVSYFVFTVHPGKLYFIHCFAQPLYTQPFTTFENARLKIEKATKLGLTFGIGGFVSGTDTIPKSFLEAGSALDYRFVKGNSNTILFDEICPASNIAAPYPRTKIEKLKNAIIGKNDSIIIDGINELIDYMDKNNIPLFAAKALCYDVVSLFLENSSPDLLNRAEESVLILSNVETARQVIEQIRVLRDTLNSKSQASNITNADKLIKQILVYVNDNYLRCDFSVQQASEHFDMLLPNFSQFFKDRTGQNILDYSTNLRMERAKELLLKTSIPLKELGYEVGYYNVSSFIRRFKQTQGLTPGDYRLLYGKFKNC